MTVTLTFNLWWLVTGYFLGAAATLGYCTYKATDSMRLSDKMFLVAIALGWPAALVATILEEMGRW